MTQQQGGDQIDDTTMLLLLLVGASGFGLFSLASFLAPVQSWLVEKGILVDGESVLVGWGEDNVGLDLGRLVVAGGAVLLLLVLAMVVVRNRVRKDV